MTELFTDSTSLHDVRTAAEAALAALPSAQPLSLGVPARDAQTVSTVGVAVRARFTGTASGGVLVIVDDALAQALAGAPAGGVAPALALRPALEAAARSIGPVQLGPAEQCDPLAGLDDLLAAGGAVVPLLAGPGVHATIGLFVDAPMSVTPSVAAASTGPGLELLRGVEMEVSAELGRARMSLDDLLGLGDGAVIELDRAAGAPADLLVNGRLIARGEVVVVDENFGIRITEIISGPASR